MVKQKEMIANHFAAKLSTAKESGRKVVYTFVPGNLTELLHRLICLRCILRSNALQSECAENQEPMSQKQRNSGPGRCCAYVK